MTIRNMLVHVDNSNASDARSAAAFEFAARFPASVRGFYARRAISSLMFAEAGASPAVYEVELESIEADTREAERHFRDAAARSGLHTSWCDSPGPLHDALIEAVALQDLAVVGRSDPDDPRCISAGLAGHLALAGGTPVLVIPPQGAPSGIGNRVVVGWNGSRESARALHDALAVLHLAAQVHVVSVDAESNSLEPVVAYLHSHGIVASPHAVTSDGVDTAEVLLRESEKHQADLVVLGAYGHSRTREWVFGGVTRGTLNKASIPVFLSH